MRIPILFGLLAALGACGASETSPQLGDELLGEAESRLEPASAPTTAARARAELTPGDDSGLEGSVLFTQLEGGIRVVALVEGLPDGLFGFHVHEGRSCERAGDHFSPVAAPHGEPGARRRHAGDLGNLRAERGRGRYDRIDNELRMDSTYSIIGRVVAIHSSQDDLNTQPDGGSGDMVACGVIESL